MKEIRSQAEKDRILTRPTRSLLLTEPVQLLLKHIQGRLIDTLTWRHFGWTKTSFLKRHLIRCVLDKTLPHQPPEEQPNDWSPSSLETCEPGLGLGLALGLSILRHSSRRSAVSPEDEEERQGRLLAESTIAGLKTRPRQPL